jgi:putative colanic acid biosysnthesis UDP-glucose lipid carrier transferase
VNPRSLRSYEGVLHPFQRAVDIVLIVAAHGLACWLYKQPWQPAMGNATVFSLVVFSIAAEILGVYRPWSSAHFVTEAKPVLGSWMVTATVLTFSLFATKTSTHFSRVVFFGWLIAAPVALCSWRMVVRAVVRALWAGGKNLRTVAIVGATPSAERLCDQIRERSWLGMKIAGVFDDRSEDRRHVFTNGPCPYVGGSADLIGACRAGLIDVVYVALPMRAEERISDLVRALSNTTATVHLVADFLSYDMLCGRWTAIGNSPILSIHDTPFRGSSRWLKRVEDIIAGFFILLIISIPLAVIALLVKLTSPGPILFRQRRYGLNGKEIRILKFRTMTVCEDGAQIAQAQRNDPRVTVLGRVLRRTSLDELPQFLQVLTGEMSIVGPRPHAVAHNEQYRSLIPNYMLRHKVKPGITGWAQVNGWRGETPTVGWMKKRVEHDLEYINNWSFFWDLKIILLTVFGRKQRNNAF